MGIFTSDGFASISASGSDWRDVSKKVLEKLVNVRMGAESFNIGFIYISDHLTEDANSIINLFRSVMGIEHWVGSIALGVCGTGEDHIDKPALSVMIGRISRDDFCVFPALNLNPDPAKTVLEKWTDQKEPMLVLVHGDPMADVDPALVLAHLEQMTGGFLVGGISSSRYEPLQFANNVVQCGISGVAFSRNISVATTLTQGCTPIGPLHTITRCDGNIVIELDGQRAFDVFSADMQALSAAIKKEEDGVEIHVAFPVSGSDRQDYLVRNALDIDQDKGWISVAHNIINGEQMLFVHRDDKTVRADLSRALIELRERVQNERGRFAPRGALYIASMARTMSGFSGGDGGEMGLVREIIGDVPLAGFYANGEISNHRLYGYTAILILFF